jgi:putative hemolysin
LLELLLVLLLVLLNGFFAMSELAVITARKNRLKKKAETHAGARQALKLAEHPERFLSAVQVWITFLGLLTGYFGGETLAAPITDYLYTFEPLRPYASHIAFVLCFGAILLVSVVLGELVPKRVGTLRAETIASAVAIPMQFLSRLAAPAVALLTWLTQLLMKLPGFNKLEQDKVDAEEIRSVVAESHEQGGIDSGERDMLNRVLRLGERDAASLMTPRTRIEWIDVRDKFDDIVNFLRVGEFSRYPVYRGDDADVLGVLDARRLVGARLDTEQDLLAFVRPPLFVSESTNALRCVEMFREEHQHLALVVDEYGGIAGVITTDDLIRAVLGRLDLVEGEEAEESMIVQREDGSWLIDGRLPAEELRELLALRHLPEEESGDYVTAAGMVIARYGRIPAVGEHFTWQGWRIEVVDLDGVRIDKLLVGRALEATAGN